MRGDVLPADPLHRQGLEAQLRRQGLLEVEAELAVGDVLAEAQQLQPHGRGQLVVLVVLVVLQVAKHVDPELAAPKRGLVGRGRVDLEAPRPRQEVRTDQHIAVRIRADPVAIARPVVDEHAGQQGALERLAGVLGGELQTNRGGQAAVQEDVVGHRGNARQARPGLAHNVGQHRSPMHVDARGAASDQVDALDLAGRDALKDGAEVVVLAGWPAAVDQHIAGRAGKAAHLGPGIEGEAGQAADHVHRRVRLHGGEEGRGIAGDAGAGGLSGDRHGQGYAAQYAHAGQVLPGSRHGARRRPAPVNLPTCFRGGCGSTSPWSLTLV